MMIIALTGMVAIAFTMKEGPSLASLRDQFVSFRSQSDVAEAGVTNVVAALVTVTEDARVENLRECFRDPYSLELNTIEETLGFHTEITYQLLRMGSRATLDLKPFARAGLYQGYIDLGRDPWGQQYYIYLGTLEPETSSESGGLWNFDDAESEDDSSHPTEATGADTPPPFVAWPGAHKEGANVRAVPAPGGLPFYVICAGPNGILDQPFLNGGVAPANGDDITSWDGYAWEVVRGNRE